MKNILIVHHSSRISGAEKSLLDMLAGFRMNRDPKYHYFISCPDGALYEKLDSKNYKVFKIPSLRIYRKAKLKYFFFIWKLIVANFIHLFIILRYSIDILHANTTIAYLECIASSILFKKPVIWHVRDHVKRSWIEKFLENKADFIIPISDAVKSTLKNPDDNKVRRIYNGISMLHHYEMSKIRYDFPYILMISQLVPWKRHDLAVEAMALLRNKNPELKLVFVGEDLFREHSKYIVSLKKRIIQLNLKDHIVWAGFQDNLHLLVQNCKLLAHPADDEPLGRVVIEALMSGRPVVVSNSGGFCEYVPEFETGFLFRKGDSLDLVKKIDFVLNNLDLLQGTQNYKETGRKLFDVKCQSQRVLHIYKELQC